MVANSILVESICLNSETQVSKSRTEGSSTPTELHARLTNWKFQKCRQRPKQLTRTTWFRSRAKPANHRPQALTLKNRQCPLARKLRKLSRTKPSRLITTLVVQAP